MLRRSEAMGVVRKALGIAHVDREQYNDDGDEYAAAVVSKKIAAYYAILASLSELPVFVNAQAIEVRAVETDDAQDIRKS